MSIAPPAHLPHFGPFEITTHNQPHDCWLSFLGKVYNVTKLIEMQGANDKCVKPILAFAGKDISHWFNARTGELQHCVHPVSGIDVPYCPHGCIPHVDVAVPTTLWRPLDTLPWWRDDDAYQVGVLTRRVRPLRLINMLIGKEVTINVCCEDTFHRIAERYFMFNTDPYSYTWRYKHQTIDMDKTLDCNGIVDERDRFAELEMPKSYHVPCVFLYYNDDFKYFDCNTDNNYCVPYNWV